MGWKTWNDRLSIILLLLIVGLWLGNAWLPKALNDSIIGATIVVFTLVAQYYFRKKEDETPTK
jgi:hypothetical protein